MQTLAIIPTKLLPDYLQQVDKAALGNFEQLHDSELSMESFSFYTSVSAVFSSKIEGEPIELDSYIKHKRFGVQFQPDYTRKIDDLHTAYEFAQANSLTPANVLVAHKLITSNILSPSYQGRLRTNNMYVTTPDGRIEYVAAEPAIVAEEMERLYADIVALKGTDLSLAEVFYFAAMIHLVFVKIHPFDDGNGRTGRLLEKWFMAEKLGAKTWFLASERHYYSQHQQYYTNLRALGVEYPELDYDKAMSFLQMLPAALADSQA